MNRPANREMNMAWQFIANTGVSVFLTGKAGTGKTTFLRKLRELMPKRMVVLAPTGVAAINAGGQTIHSFFQLPFGPYVPGVTKSESNSHFKMSDKKKDLIRTLDLLVIDEVSMVRVDMLDQIDDVMRRYRNPSQPFGGVQLLLIGDLMQLSPVAADREWAMLSEYYDTPYFFSSKALANLNYVTIELKHIYRQQDSEFIDILAAVRQGCVTDDVLRRLNTRYLPGFRSDTDGWIRLTTHNHTAQQHNEMRLAMLSTRPRTLNASVQGDFPESSYPTDPNLVLKEGAQVMFVKNDPSGAQKYYNGKIGRLTKITEEGLTVVDESGQKIDVVPVVWENTKYTLDKTTKAIKEEVVGTFTQYPLRLAWAITVHKSQGLTFDHAVLDINSSFAHGQVYVALSRCRTLEGMVLANPISPRSVITDTTVNSYIDKALSHIEENVVQLPKYQLDYTVSLLDELYSMTQMVMRLQWLTRVVDEHLSFSNRSLLNELKEKAIALNNDIVVPADKFKVLYRQTIVSAGLAPLCPRIRKSAEYFQGKIKELFAPLLEHAVIAIDNKQLAQTYNNALEALRSELNLKLGLFDGLAKEDFSIGAYLNIKAKVLLNVTSVKAPTRSGRSLKQAKQAKPPKPKKEATTALTLQMHRQGMSVEQIARARKLTTGTIFKHLIELHDADSTRLDIDRIVPEVHRRQILNALRSFTSAFSLSDMRPLLPDEISYDEMKFVIAASKQKK